MAALSWIFWVTGLVDLALAMPGRFYEIVELILPLLGPIASGSVRASAFLDVERDLIAQYPKHLLDLLWKVLPEDPWLWPYETRSILDALSAQGEVKNDQRLGELVRRERNR